MLLVVVDVWMIFNAVFLCQDTTQIILQHVALRLRNSVLELSRTLGTCFPWRRLWFLHWWAPLRQFPEFWSSVVKQGPGICFVQRILRNCSVCLELPEQKCLTTWSVYVCGMFFYFCQTEAQVWPSSERCRKILFCQRIKGPSLASESCPAREEA